MKLNPSLYQAQLFMRQLSRQHLTIIDPDRCFKFRVPRMYVRRAVMLIVQKIHPDDDPIEH